MAPATELPADTHPDARPGARPNMQTDGRTLIYRTRQFDAGRSEEEVVGFIDADGIIYRIRWDKALSVGRVSSDMHVLRSVQHGERELGQALPTGAIHSAGLLEGGNVGWMEPDGIVVQGGLYMGEEEVGRVVGPRALAAAAALLLLFLPDEAEANHRAAR